MIITQLQNISKYVRPMYVYLQAGEDCVCGQRRIQDEGERKRKQPQRKKIPSVFPLPMSPGYATASQWSSLAVS